MDRLLAPGHEYSGIRQRGPAVTWLRKLSLPTDCANTFRLLSYQENLLPSGILPPVVAKDIRLSDCAILRHRCVQAPSLAQVNGAYSMRRRRTAITASAVRLLAWSLSMILLT